MADTKKSNRQEDVIRRTITQYGDIINLPHPISKNHPQMSISDRAAQFSPFAALTGHGDAIKETDRLVEALMQEETEAWTEE